MERYDLRHLPRDGAQLSETLGAEWLEAELNPGSIAEETRLLPEGPGEAELRLDRVDPDAEGPPVVRVTGRVRARLKTSCGRCLAEVALAVDDPVDRTFFPELPPVVAANEGGEKAGKKGKRARPAEPTEDEAPSDVDQDTYRDLMLDLPALVREVVLLAIDMNPTCPDEDGCDARTRDLLASVNPVENPDEAPAIDPRWAALRKIDLKSE